MVEAYNTEDRAMEEANGTVEPEDFNLNDPKLYMDWRPDVDEKVEGEPEHIERPPYEGISYVRITLREQKEEDKPVLKIVPPKNKKGGVGNWPPGVQATCAGRIVTWSEEMGEWMNGAFTKDIYPSTIRYMETETMSKMAALMSAARKPFPNGRMSISEMFEHVKEVFEEVGEEGIYIPAMIRWIMPVQKLDKDGDPIFNDETGKPELVDVKGSGAIKARAVAAAKKEAKELGFDKEQTKLHMADAKARAHMYIDAEGDLRRVNIEIDRFASSQEWLRHQAKLEKAAVAQAAAA